MTANQRCLLANCGDSQKNPETTLFEPLYRSILAIRNHFPAEDVQRSALIQTLEDTGSGILASLNGSTVFAGNPYWLSVDQNLEVEGFIQRGLTLLCITIDNKLVAAFGLKGILRLDAVQIIEILHRRGITCHIVRGDGANDGGKLRAQIGSVSYVTRSIADVVLVGGQRGFLFS